MPKNFFNTDGNGYYTNRRYSDAKQVQGLPASRRPLIRKALGSTESVGEIKTEDPLSAGMASRLSIVDVDMSIDLKIAKVFVSTVGSESEKKEALKWLSDHSKNLRYALAQRMKHLRSVPELRFAAADMGAAMGIMSLLEQLRAERLAKAAANPADELADDDLTPHAAAAEDHLDSSALRP